MIVRGAELGLQRLALEIAAVLGERDLLRWSAGRRDADLRLRIEALRRGRVDDPHVAADVRVDGGARQRALRSVDVLERQLETRQRRSRALRRRTLTSADCWHSRIPIASRSRAARAVDICCQADAVRDSRMRKASRKRSSWSSPISTLATAKRSSGSPRRCRAPRSKRISLHSSSTGERFEWDAREQAVVAQDERWLGAIRLGERRLDNPDSARVTNALLAGIRELGLDALPWTKEARALRQRLAFAREVDAQAPRPWPDVSDAALLVDTRRLARAVARRT